MGEVVILDLLQGDGFHIDADDVLNGALGKLSRPKNGQPH